MAERFVFGFAVSVDALEGLVGSRLDADELLATVSNEFVDMFDDEFSSEITLTRCMRNVLAGHLDENLAYPYARLVEPILTVVAEPLGMIHMAHTYYLPNESFGRWNRRWALGFGRLAALWGTASCAFPWRVGARRPSISHASPTLRLPSMNFPGLASGGAPAWPRCRTPSPMTPRQPPRPAPGGRALASSPAGCGGRGPSITTTLRELHRQFLILVMDGGQ